MNVATFSAAELAARVRSREISATQAVDAALADIERLNPSINAFTAITPERARRKAAALDRVIADGREPGPLAGVPFAVKNLFDIEGVVTLAGSMINRESAPATRDATAVQRLEEAGAICVGALNMGEYAYDFTTENTHYGPTRNPHDLTRSAGGSSGGSSAAVAAGMVPLSVGTDTNGSIRVPSSFCGIWGLKPTYSRLSRAGGFLFVESLDHIGPFARSVRDLSLAFDAMQGPDPRDPVCATRLVNPATPTLDKGVVGLRVARLGGYFAEGGAAEAHSAVDEVARALSVNREIELPTPAIARAAAYIITASEGGNRHYERLKTRAADFDPNTRDRFLAGALLPSGWYLQAQKFRAVWREQVKRIFADVDILIAPATPVSATKIGQEMMTLGGSTLLVRPNLGLFTQPISFIGLPVVAAPLHRPGLPPIAVQLIGAPWSESTLLRCAAHLEAVGVCSAPLARLKTFSS